MIKVLIVDDEHWVAESIRLSIDWSSYGLEVIGVAHDGLKAYESILKDRPDIVLTDIRMPKMNGLELIKKVNESETKVKFIVISGHADFSYAQQAMHENAIGYCLKPVDNRQLIELLHKAKEALKFQPVLNDIGLFDMLVNYSPDMETEVRLILRKYDIDCSDKRNVHTLVSLGKAPLEFRQGIRTITGNIGKCKFASLLQLEDAGAFICNPQRYIKGEYKSIGIGSCAATLPEIKLSLERANLSSYQYFIQKGVKIFQLVFSTSQELDLIIKDIIGHITIKNVESTIEKLQALPDVFRTNGYNIKHIFYFYNSIMQNLYKSSEERMDSYLFNYEQLISMYEDMDSMMTTLIMLVLKHMDKPMIDCAAVDNTTIKQILFYTKVNYSKNISLNDLSQKFFANPNYLSQLFKKEVGLNFTEYVSSLRIKKACELFDDYTLTLQEIALRTGYNDYFYFSRVFKKQTGKTPSQYRELLKRDKGE